MLDDQDWYKKGTKHIWHPYCQMQTMPTPLKIKSAHNCIITTEDGTELIDGISSWWSVCHGYNHPYITEQIKKQLDILPHIMFAGTAHEPAYRLASRLCALTGMDKVFFSDSGSTAIETAMKIAIQYWLNLKVKNRYKFISFRHSYHGDTMGAMSICDPDDGMHKIFANHMPKQFSLKIPSDEYQFAEFKELLAGIKHNVAGLIIEPLVQGAGGMKFHSADILAEIYNICQENDILFIADEVMTGFGRTGTMFACQEASIIPDIMCLGKALTGGFMTLSACLVRDKIFSGFLGESPNIALMSGPTFMANPLACSAANASLDLFLAEDRISQINAIETQLYYELEHCRHLKNVIDVRIKGAIGVIQLRDCNYEKIRSMHQYFISKNIFLRPFGDIIYVMPPFTITQGQLKQITTAIYNYLS